MPIERFVALQWVAIIAVLSGLFYLLAPILTPFIAAAILAYICDPWVSKLCKLKWLPKKSISRTLAALLVMAMLIGLLSMLFLIMLPLLQREIEHFAESLPVLLETVRLKLLPLLQQYIGADLQWNSEAFKNLLTSHLQSAGGAAAKVLPWLGGGGVKLLAILMNLLLIPLVLFYLLRDWPLLLIKMERVIPRHLHTKATEIAKEVDEVLAQFLRGQISVMLLMSAFYVFGLWLSGLEFALPIGVVAGMLVFIPYLGMFTGLLLASLAAFTQFDQFSSIVIVWGVFGLGQMLEGMLITPWLVGDRIGLHPLAVIFALLAFGQLFGFVGLLLALPISAALVVGLRHAGVWYFNSSLYKK